MTAIFLAAPFTGLIDPKTGQIPETNPVRAKMSAIGATLSASGFSVFSAHEREEWGKNLYAPQDALRIDLDWLRKADALVAEIGTPPSPGVQMEIGFFIALGKPILISSPIVETSPYLSQGLSANANINFLSDTSAEKAPTLVLDWCRKLQRA